MREAHPEEALFGNCPVPPATVGSEDAVTAPTGLTPSTRGASPARAPHPAAAGPRGAAGAGQGRPRARVRAQGGVGGVMGVGAGAGGAVTVGSPGYPVLLTVERLGRAGFLQCVAGNGRDGGGD